MPSIQVTLRIKDFFVYYTNNSGDSVISEFRATSGVIADASSERVIMTVEQPFSNHNGGQIFFSPIDGYLYIGLGDGGSGGDPQNHGQDRSTLLGSMLRIDVDGEAPYQVPSNNPFISENGVRPEIWAYGLRNPWRFSFDRLTGELFAGDVGQGEREEVDLIVSRWKLRLENYGRF